MTLKSDTDSAASKSAMDTCSQASPSPPAPKVGDIVMVDTGNRGGSSTTDVWPAIVTRRWSGSCLNARVFSEGGEVLQTSISHKSTIAPPTRFNQPRPVYWYFPWEEPIS